MSKIKQVIVENIYRKLDGKFFSIPDFDVKFPDDSNVYVEIKFRHDPSYFFAVTEEVESQSGVVGLINQFDRKKKPHKKESPGDFKAVEWRAHDDFNEALSRIDVWCKNLNEELRARTPALKEIERLRAQFEEQFSEEVPDPDGHFNSEELASLAQKFDQLQEKLKSLEEQHQITKQELESALEDIKSIKENAANLPKGLWAKVTKNRMVTLIGRIVSSKEGRKFMFEAAEKLLLNNDSSPKP